LSGGHPQGYRRRDDESRLVVGLPDLSPHPERVKGSPPLLVGQFAQTGDDAQYLKVFVRRLRQKLGDDAEQPRYIQTQWGVGYRFVAPA
jgi:DNA-binding response OmpR family regulator